MARTPRSQINKQINPSLSITQRSIPVTYFRMASLWFIFTENHLVPWADWYGESLGRPPKSDLRSVSSWAPAGQTHHWHTSRSNNKSEISGKLRGPVVPVRKSFCKPNSGKRSQPGDWWNRSGHQVPQQGTRIDLEQIDWNDVETELLLLLSGSLFGRARRQRLRNLRQHGAVPSLRDHFAVSRRPGVSDVVAESQHLLHGRSHPAAGRRQALPAGCRADALLGAAAQQNFLRTHPIGAHLRISVNHSTDGQISFRPDITEKLGGTTTQITCSILFQLFCEYLRRFILSV